MSPQECFKKLENNLNILRQSNLIKLGYVKQNNNKVFIDVAGWKG